MAIHNPTKQEYPNNGDLYGDRNLTGAFRKGTNTVPGAGHIPGSMTLLSRLVEDPTNYGDPNEPLTIQEKYTNDTEGVAITNPATKIYKSITGAIIDHGNYIEVVGQDFSASMEYAYTGSLTVTATTEATAQQIPFVTVLASNNTDVLDINDTEHSAFLGYDERYSYASAITVDNTGTQNEKKLYLVTKDATSGVTITSREIKIPVGGLGTINPEPLEERTTDITGTPINFKLYVYSPNSGLVLNYLKTRIVVGVGASIGIYQPLENQRLSTTDDVAFESVTTNSISGNGSPINFTGDVSLDGTLINDKYVQLVDSNNISFGNTTSYYNFAKITGLLANRSGIFEFEISTRYYAGTLRISVNSTTLITISYLSHELSSNLYNAEFYYTVDGADLYLYYKSIYTYDIGAITLRKKPESSFFSIDYPDIYLDTITEGVLLNRTLYINQSGDYQFTNKIKTSELQTNSISGNGSTVVFGDDIDINNHKITGLLAGTTSGDAVEYNQLNTALSGYLPLTAGATKALQGDLYGGGYDLTGFDVVSANSFYNTYSHGNANNIVDINKQGVAFNFYGTDDISDYIGSHFKMDGTELLLWAGWSKILLNSTHNSMEIDALSLNLQRHSGYITKIWSGLDVNNRTITNINTLTGYSTNAIKLGLNLDAQGYDVSGVDVLSASNIVSTTNAINGIAGGNRGKLTIGNTSSYALANTASILLTNQSGSYVIGGYIQAIAFADPSSNGGTVGSMIAQKITATDGAHADVVIRTNNLATEYTFTEGGAFVLANKSSDPTAVNGGIYYNSSTNKVRICEAGTWRDI